MKTFKIFILTIVSFFGIQSLHAQSDKYERVMGIKSQTIRVNGTCGMCKKRIEKTALSVDGVKSAIWDEDTERLTVKYGIFKKDAMANIETQLAKAGHSNEKLTADDNAYNSLPECCHYRTY